MYFYFRCIEVEESLYIEWYVWYARGGKTK